MSPSDPSVVPIFFTDLDGTLLDERSYSFEAALPALERLRGCRALLVPCTSKTCEELRPILDDLGFHHPFIVENGGAFYFPARLFGTSVPGAEQGPDWIRVELGTPYARLTDFLRRVRERKGLRITGFNDLTPEEIVRECGLTYEEACRAAVREFDEPFRLNGPDPDADLRILAAEAEREGLTLSRGGRFHHVFGGSDKGRAIRMLTQLVLQCRFGPIFTVGLGDSPNDVPMLKNVDLPVIVQRPSGEYHPDLLREVPGARRAAGIGPQGWNRAVLDILREKRLP